MQNAATTPAPVHLLLQLDIEPKNFSKFEAIISKMVAMSEQEPGTTLYHFFLSADRRQCRLLEGYVDTAAITEHFKGPAVQELVPQMLSISQLTGLEFYGDPGPEVAAIAAALNPANFTAWHGFDRTVSRNDVLKGEHWSAEKVGDTYIVSVDDKSSVLQALTDFVTSQKIQAGEVTGIGAVNEATLRFFDPATKKYVDKTYTEQMEMSNLSANVSLEDGKPWLHMHATFGRADYTALAGHLLDAKLRGAGEFFVYPIPAKVVKVKNEDVGLYFYSF